MLVIWSDSYNQSKLATVVAIAITTNTNLAAMPGNVFLPLALSGLSRDSVINATALVTLNKTDLVKHSRTVPISLMDEVERGLKRVLEI